MQPSEELSYYDASKRNVLIICGAICLGALVFAAVVLVISLPDGVQFALTPFAIAAGLLAPIGVATSFFLGQILKAQSIQKWKETPPTSPQGKRSFISNAIQTNMIVRYAIMEGPVMLALVAAMVERNLLPWCIAVLIVAIMISQLPLPFRYNKMVHEYLDQAN